MNISLLKVLIERNIIGVRTEIDARYRGRDIAGNPLVAATGTFLILEINPTESGYSFLCADTIDGQRRRLSGDQIVGVDGMDPIRLAANYELDENGNKVKVGKRRGRKPRSALIGLAA
ncbi:MAG: hypothetical protein EOP83_31090, partial [Verrucomicrobiaceae bacterium]